MNKTKYLPPVIKEWKNSVYNYNSNNTMNYPVYDLHLNSLIRGYFSMYFNHEFIPRKFIPVRRKRKSLNKIFVSKAEVKHTNSKAIITIYVYNREKILLLKKLKGLKRLVKFLLKESEQNNFINKIFKGDALLSLTTNTIKLMKGDLREKELDKKIKIMAPSARKLNKEAAQFNFFLDSYSLKITRILSIVRNFRLKLNLNRNKFEDVFLSRLSKAMSKYYGKKVEFNIVNLKSFTHNVDIFTEILTSKIKKEQASPMYQMTRFLNLIKLPEVNTIIERGRVEKSVDDNLAEQKYRNNSLSLNLNSDDGVVKRTTVRSATGVTTVSSSPLSTSDLSKNNDSLNHLLENIYDKSSFITNPHLTLQDSDSVNSSKGNIEKNDEEPLEIKIRNTVLENVKYKHIGGVRLRVKGRLTKRYRADRAVNKLRWKGGLKNIDSAFKGLTAVQNLGYQDSNVTTSFIASKRRIGSFGVKAWMGGRN